MQLLISKCSQANGKWTDQFTRNWDGALVLPFGYAQEPRSRWRSLS